MESDLNNWLSTQCIATVHIQCVCPQALIRSSECGLVTMVMLLHCYAYAKNNNTVSNTDVVLRHDNMLTSHWIIMIMDLILRGSIRNAGSWNVRLYSVLPSLLVSTLNEVSILAVYCLVSVWYTVRNNTSLFLQRHLLCFLQKTSDVFMFYLTRECEKAMLNPIWRFWTWCCCLFEFSNSNKNILICVLTMNGGLTGLERHQGE